MQYWQRKLQRSVTETRRSPIGRPWPSTRGARVARHPDSVDDAHVPSVPFTLLGMFAVRPLEGTPPRGRRQADGIARRPWRRWPDALRLPRDARSCRTSDSPTADIPPQDLHDRERDPVRRPSLAQAPGRVVRTCAGALDADVVQVHCARVSSASHGGARRAQRRGGHPRTWPASRRDGRGRLSAGLGLPQPGPAVAPDQIPPQLASAGLTTLVRAALRARRLSNRIRVDRTDAGDGRSHR